MEPSGAIRSGIAQVNTKPPHDGEMDLLLAAEMSWEPWIGLATVAIAIVGALIAFNGRLTTVEVKVKAHEEKHRKIDSALFPAHGQPTVPYRHRHKSDDSETA